MVGQIATLEENQKSGNASANQNTISENGASEDADSILQICQRIRVEDTNNDEESEGGQIWALVEYETNPDGPAPYRRYKKWQSFATESELADFIRRDTGEPLVLPAYSLTPQQSEAVQADSKEAVARITEEFRRFRVRAEVARKQADATVRALHSNNVVTTRAKIQGQDLVCL